MRHIVAAAIHIRARVHDNDRAAIGSSRQSIELHSRLGVFDNEAALVLYHFHKTVDGRVPEPPGSSEFLGSLLGICGRLHLLGFREGWSLLRVKAMPVATLVIVPTSRGVSRGVNVPALGLCRRTCYRKCSEGSRAPCSLAFCIGLRFFKFGSSFGFRFKLGFGFGFRLSLGFRLRLTLVSVLGSTLASDLGSALASGLSSALASGLGSTLASGLGSTLVSVLGSTLASGLGSALSSGLGSTLASGLDPTLASGLG